MAKEIDDKTVFDGWEAMSNTMLNTGANPGDLPIVDPEDIKKDLADDDDKKTDDDTDDGDVDDKNKDDNVDDKSDDKDDDKVDDDSDDDSDDDTSDTDDDIDDKDLAQYESDITQVFQEKLGEELGWSFNEDEKFESVKDMVDYLKNVITEGSVPQFASNEMEEMNKFVAQGGELKNFYDATLLGGLDVEGLDLEKEPDQKSVIREELKIRGYKQNRIEKTLDRYEDAGDLQDEAEESVEFLKNYKEQTKQKLLKDQETSNVQVKEEQQKFYSNVEQSVKDIKDIRGIKISSKEKKDLLDYIFKPDSTGSTSYQREYAENAVKNLIESAYFTKQGDTLVARAKKQGSTDANRDLFRKMKASNKNKRQKAGGGQGDISSGSDNDTLAQLGRSLI